MVEPQSVALVILDQYQSMAPGLVAKCKRHQIPTLTILGSNPSGPIGELAQSEEHSVCNGEAPVSKTGFSIK